MEPKNEPTPSEQQQPAEQPPAPRRRFRIEKLEARIAPKNNKKSQGGTDFIPPLTSSSSVSY